MDGASEAVLKRTQDAGVTADLNEAATLATSLPDNPKVTVVNNKVTIPRVTDHKKLYELTAKIKAISSDRFSEANKDVIAQVQKKMDLVSQAATQAVRLVQRHALKEVLQHFIGAWNDASSKDAFVNSVEK
eukprot:3414971-Pyramimonas_sp.AAC.1